MTQPTTTTFATVADFTPADPMLFHKAKKKWFRFVVIDPLYLAIFSGTGGLSCQTWEYIITIDKSEVRTLWDQSVLEGYNRVS